MLRITICIIVFIPEAAHNKGELHIFARVPQFRIESYT